MKRFYKFFASLSIISLIGASLAFGHGYTEFGISGGVSNSCSLDAQIVFTDGTGGNLQCGGNPSHDGNLDISGGLTVTVPDADNQVGLTVANNDTTNNTDHVVINGTSTGQSLFINTGTGALENGIAMGAADSGFYPQTVNQFRLVLGGQVVQLWSTTAFNGQNAGKYYLYHSAAGSLTNPTYAYTGDNNTGMYTSGDDENAIVAGGVMALTHIEASSHVLAKHEVHAGITASTTQTQGNGLLLSSYNEISTVANANDTVTLPVAEAGLKVTIMNNGANTLQIFPNTSDNLGAGVDTATTLAAGSNVTYFAYDATNWESI